MANSVGQLSFWFYQWRPRGSQCPLNNKPQWLQGGGEQCYQEPFHQNGRRVWGQSVPQQVPLGYQYIFGGLSGNFNVVPQTS